MAKRRCAYANPLPSCSATLLRSGDVANKLKDPISAERKFDEVVQSAQSAAVLVLVY